MKNSYLSPSFALWSGSSPAKKSHIQKGIKRLLHLGLDTHNTETHASEWSKKDSLGRPYLNQDDQSKVNRLKKLLLKKEVKNILCVRGGYGNIRLLPHLDKISFQHIKQKKVIWGYSDSTVIQHYFFMKKKWPWVHSPMLCSPSFYNPIKQEIRAWRKILHTDAYAAEHSLSILSRTTKAPDAKNYPLLGGNLASLCSMIGTPWEPSYLKGYILFLEDIAEPAYKIDRLLQQLSSSKFFRSCRAVLLGHFTQCPQALKTIKLWVDEKKLFCARGIPAGHQKPNIPLSMGREIQILKPSSSKKIILRAPKLYL